MDQVIRTAILWALGSRNPAADCARLSRRQPVARPPAVPTPSTRVESPVTGSSSALGKTFEDRVVNDIMPTVATKLGVSPASSICRLTRSVPRSGDFAIHYRDQIGLVELKNHTRAVGVIDRRRFFESLMVNYKNIDWAIMITSRCSVPHFGEKGYTVVGRLIIDLHNHQRTLPVAFVCGLDILGPQALEGAIVSLSTGGPPVPHWNVSDLLTRGELNRTHELSWGTLSDAFKHPPGAIFGAGES